MSVATSDRIARTVVVRFTPAFTEFGELECDAPFASEPGVPFAPTVSWSTEIVPTLPGDAPDDATMCSLLTGTSPGTFSISDCATVGETARYSPSPRFKLAMAA